MRTTIDLCNFDLSVLQVMRDALNEKWQKQIMGHWDDQTIPVPVSIALSALKVAKSAATKDDLILAICQVSAAIDIVEQREKVNSN